MTKISSKTAYPKKKPISSDYFVGTDSEDFNKTVNFGFEEVAGLVNKLNGTPLLNYLFSTSPYLSTEVLLEGRFLSDENELSTPSLTKLHVNKFNNSGDNLQELYLFLQANATDFYLKLRNSNNQNNAVYFDIASIEDFPDYFILNITVFKENEFLPLLENLNVYFFDFELKATSAGTSDPLKLDKDGYTGTAKNIDDRILVLENQTDIDNAFIVKPTFALATNILTINALGKWKLEGVIYENLTNVTFPIAYCATGKTRLDYFVPNNANGFDKISGVETLGVAIAPQLPNEGLYVTYILVSDSGVGEPVTPPSVVIPTFHQVLGSGYSTTRYIWFFNNINSFCTRFASDHILFQKLESVFNFIRADNTTQSYNIQLPNKIGGAEQTFAMVSDLTKSQVGLSNVDNTSDATKPVSGPQQTALDLKVDKVTGKGLSTEDYTTSEKNKLASITEIFTTALKSSYDGVVTGYTALIATGSRLITTGEITKLTNTSGTNSGDNATNTQYSGLATSKENVANKSDSYTTSSSTTYASTKALVDGLATKANDSGMVHKSGDETITGFKTFTEPGFSDNAVVIAPGEIRISNNAIEYPAIIRADNVTDVRDIQMPNASGTIALTNSPAFTGTPTAPTAPVGTNTTQIATMEALYAATTTELAYALADETANLTVSTRIKFRMPHAMTLSEVRISLNDAPTLSSVVVDVKENGVSIFSTLLSIDANEKTSVTAAIPAVISDINLADDAEITVSTTQIGSGDTGKGLKILFKGRKA